MHSTATALIDDQQAKAALLGDLIDSMVDIISVPRPAPAKRCSFSALERAFAETGGMPKSLLVVRVENDRSADATDAGARLAMQDSVARQLQAACGRYADVAAIGNQEYAVLLPGVDQCSELIPRLERLLARTAAGHLNGDGAALECRIGVARCPIDTDALSDLIRMASNAAAELGKCELGYQFISRRHR